MNFSAVLIVSGYNFFVYSHVCFDSVGSSSAITIVDALHDKLNSKLSDADRIVFPMSFPNREEISKHLFLSIVKTIDNSEQEEAKVAMRFAIINYLMQKING